MVRKQGKNTLRVANRYKNLFVFKTSSKAKAMLMKWRGKSTYLLSINPQIRLWHRRLGLASNARVVEASKLTDGIDITIEEGLEIQEEPFSSNSEVDDEDKNSEQSPTSNTPLILVTTLLNKVTSTGINPNHSIEQLCDFYIESKRTKIVRYKKMTPTICKFEENYANLWGPHNPPLLLRRIYVGLLLNKFIRKLSVLIF